MAPKSPFLNFDEKLSLNEREKGTYEGYMTEDGIEAPNYVKRNDTIVDTDDTPLADIKLSDFELDFDVWKSVIDETQEDCTLSEDKFSHLDKRSTAINPSKSQNDIMIKGEQVIDVDKSINKQQTESNDSCKNESRSTSITNPIELHGYQHHFDGHQDDNTQTNDFARHSHSFSANQFNVGYLNPLDPLPPQAPNPKQNHRIKVNNLSRYFVAPMSLGRSSYQNYQEFININDNLTI